MLAFCIQQNMSWVMLSVWNTPMKFRLCNQQAPIMESKLKM